MKNFFKLFGVIALAAVIGFSMAACGGDDDDDDGGGVPSALVGKWYKADQLAFEITYAGKLIVPDSETFDISVEGKTVTLKKSGTEVGTFDYAISGGEMTITNGTISGMAFVPLSPVVKGGGNTQPPPTGLAALVGSWYKSGLLAFEVTSAGKFIMNDTTYDISVSGSTATLKFGDQTVGTFDFAINNGQMVLFSGTGIGVSVAAFSTLSGGSTGFTVTFDKNGGDTEASPKTKTVTAGATVGTLPTPPTRKGAIFGGWLTAPNGGTDFTASTIVTGNITVYAKWVYNMEVQ